jgi:hypothetical protein
VYEQHRQAIEKARPEMLTVTNADEKERPVIMAISDFAQNPDLFSITHGARGVHGPGTLRRTSQGEWQGGAQEGPAKRSISDLTGKRSYTLQHVFVKWLFTLNMDTDFDKSSPIDIADYYHGQPTAAR